MGWKTWPLRLKTDGIFNKVEYNQKQSLTWHDSKMCKFDTSVFILTFYSIYFDFLIQTYRSSTSPIISLKDHRFQLKQRGQSQLTTSKSNFQFLSKLHFKILQWKKANHMLAFDTIKFLTPYKSLIFSHLLLSKDKAYSSKNLEILVYNKLKPFLINS